MIISLQDKNNKELAKKIESELGITIVQDEIFIGIDNGHLFKVGEKAELYGLEDYPQFNGEIVTITSIRQDGQYGKAYYFKTTNKDLAENLNWTYEYRLKKID